MIRILIFVRKGDLEGEFTGESLKKHLRVLKFERVGIIGSSEELDLTEVVPCCVELGKLRRIPLDMIKYYAKRSYLCYYVEGEKLSVKS